MDMKVWGIVLVSLMPIELFIIWIMRMVVVDNKRDRERLTPDKIREYLNEQSTEVLKERRKKLYDALSVCHEGGLNGANTRFLLSSRIDMIDDIISSRESSK